MKAIGGTSRVVRVDRALYEELERLAKAGHRPVRMQLEMVLERGLAAENKKESTR